MESANTANKSLFEKEVSPYLQLTIVLGVVLLFQVVIYFFNRGASSSFMLRTHYTISLAFSLVFALFNAVLSLSTQNQNLYWGKSIVSYFILCTTGLLMAYLFSGLTIDEAGSYRWIYAVFTFGYIMLLAIIRSIRKIVVVAQKQDSRLRGE
jgi:hypothetical protein